MLRENRQAVSIPCSKGLLLQDIKRSLYCWEWTGEVSIPCSKGLLLQGWGDAALTFVRIRVSIPCSKGLLLQGLLCRLKDECRYGFNPLFKGSTTSSFWVEDCHLTQLQSFQSPVQRVYYFKENDMKKWNLSTFGKFQSPVQRVYYFKFRGYSRM